MHGVSAFVSPPVRAVAARVSGGALDRFADLAGALEGAAAAIARLDTRLTGHPLAPAWLWRIRLEAVRRHAAADGLAIDPWHLPPTIKDARFPLDPALET